MGRLALLLTVLVGLGVGNCAFGAADVAVDSGLVAPPALHIPYGGQVITDINFADGDVLGMARQMLPALIEAAKPLAAAKLPSGADARLVQDLDIKPLLDAVAGVTNVRVVISKFSKPASSAKMIDEIEAGVAKIGKFSRVAEDTQSTSGFLLVYAQTDGGGYVGFAYDPHARELYAGRVVGAVDVAKLQAWVMDIATKSAMKSKSTAVPPSQPKAAPETPAK